MSTLSEAVGAPATDFFAQNSPAVPPEPFPTEAGSIPLVFSSGVRSSDARWDVASLAGAGHSRSQRRANIYANLCKELPT